MQNINIYKYPNQDAVYFYIVNLNEINNIVIPFFGSKKNPIYGSKYLDYLCPLDRLVKNSWNHEWRKSFKNGRLSKDYNYKIKNE